ncbi:MAG: tetratricopeptide repeat protein [Armatimonadetes bacterium]|nr:tetratricopeptide repeat protein [Armatimonadota bacterium]
MTQEIEQLMSSGNWDAAQAACQKAIDDHPGNAKLVAYMGLMLFRKNQYEAASEYFRKAFVLEPKFWEAGLKLAQCLDRLMRYDEALKVAYEVRGIKQNDATLSVLISGLERQVGTGNADWEKRSHNIYLSDK